MAHQLKEAESLPVRAKTVELLCVPFLDTDTTAQTRRADLVLSQRGYPAWLIKALRALCGIGLWTQVLVWEEWILDLGDVLMGYGVLLFIFGIPVGLVGLKFSPLAAWVGASMLVVGPLLIVSAVIYWRRTRVSAEQPQ